MLIIECNQCHKMAFTADGRQPDKALECDCCAEEHDHGRAANQTGTPCRPVTIHVPPNSASLSVM